MSQKFCFSCGSPIAVVQAKFCSNCGINLDNHIPNVPHVPVSQQTETNPIRIIKPVFSLPLQIIRTYFSPFLPMLVFLSVWVSGVLSGLYNKANHILPSFYINLVEFITELLGLNQEFILKLLNANQDFTIMLANMVLTLPLFVGILPLFWLLYQKLTYRKTEYKIFEKKVEYTETFLSEDWKTLSYERVVEVHLRKGFIQKLFGLGSIFLEVPASGGEGVRNGINIFDVENSEEMYRFIKDLIRSH